MPSWHGGEAELYLFLNCRWCTLCIHIYLVVQVNEPVFTLEGEGVKADYNLPFPLPWDLPLSAYGADDKPWVSEYLDL